MFMLYCVASGVFQSLTLLLKVKRARHMADVVNAAFRFDSKRVPPRVGHMQVACRHSLSHAHTLTYWFLTPVPATVGHR